ncbi:MAG TPA: MOSC N-terminal beta barrel domain-containing protein [Actinomycetota bacterium]|nr:MOSC N-terminal beta barrel domain-containing protein [Actinomycetota bacterium]
MPHVTRISITPVKSMRLHHPDRVRVETFGVLENRRFYVAEPGGRLINNVQCGPLQRIRSEWDPQTERLALHFPDGRVAEGDGSDVDGQVRTVFYQHLETGRVVGGPFSDALSEYVGRPVVLARTDEPGAGSDSFPVSLYSQASAEEIDRRAGRTDAHDRRRWRMLLEVDEVGPHEEDRWIGCRVAVGDAVFRVAKQVGRCVITTQDPETGVPDFDTLRTIKSYRPLRNGKSLDFGVYAEVEVPGSVGMGDAVEVLEPATAR